MDFSSLFKHYLFSQSPPLSSITVKNYLSDLQRFFTWYREEYKQSFESSAFSEKTIAGYKNHLVSVKSSNRHLSTLRRFGDFLVSMNLIPSMPEELRTLTPEERPDNFFIQRFTTFLQKTGTADISIKNYIIDIQQFLSWLSLVKSLNGDNEAFLASLSTHIFEEYQHRLYGEKVAQATIERKLSALRKYISFLRDIQPDKINPIIISTIPYSYANSQQINDEQSVDTIANPTAEAFRYSSFPPLRFFQKVGRGILFFIDWLFIIPFANTIVFFQYLLWLLSGQKLFVVNEEIKPKLREYVQSKKRQKKNPRFFSENYYAPLSDIKDYKSNTWIYKGNKRYQTLLKNPFFSFAHYGILLLLVTFIAIHIYMSIFLPHGFNSAVLGASTSQRLLSFSAKLLDQQQQPITHSTPVRFSLYTDPTASSSALLWQDIRTVTPNKDGSFSITLGTDNPIPSSLFSDNPSIYLGTTIGSSSELRPRNAIPTVGLSNDSNTLQGMKVLTVDSDNPRNTILALDSTGNLRIGGASSPTFQATNGTFTLSGQQVLLTTNLQSNGNLVLAPDGSGKIDLQKALTNSLGSVSVNDSFAVLATTSASAAMQIDQNFTGPLISASSSGVNKFLVDYVGSGTFANNLAVNGNDLTTSSPEFNLLNTTVEQIQFGNAATNISIGNTKGTTTINNAITAVGGNLTVGGSVGTTLTADGAGIQFGGNGDHLLIASQGALLIGSNINLQKDVSIVRSTTDGTSNIGSSDKPFDNLYVKNLNISNISTANNLGIGTSNPAFKLDVIDTIATAAAMITNQSTDSRASVLDLKLASLSTSSNPNPPTHFIDFLNGNGNVIGSIEASQSGGITLKSSNADFAEFLPKDANENIPAGSLVCLTSNGEVTNCDQTSTTIAGAVSTTPTILAGKNNGNKSVIVGMQGQIAVNVSTQNGPIQPGDPIASSNIPGVGVKAIRSGTIIGHALAAYTNPDPYIIGQVLVLVQPSWFDPSIRLTDSGNLSIAMLDNNQPQSEPDQPVDTPSFNLIDTYNNVLTASAAYSSALIANLQASVIKTQRLLVSGNAHISQLFADSIVIGGTNLQDYITHIVQQIHPATATSQLASISELKTNTISPLASNAAVLIQGNLQTTGDASIAGTLAAQTVQAQDASISGTLHVKKLIADEIDGQATSSATYITNIYNATSSATAITAPISPTPPAEIASAQSDEATTSGLIAADLLLQNLAQQPIQTPPNYINVPAVSIQFANVTGSFMNTGGTSLSDTAIAGKLSIDNQLTLVDNTINVLGADLEIQPLRQGGVSFLSGLVAIDTSGNLSVNGNATFAQNVTVNGTLATNTISPLANNTTLSNSPNNLTVKLGTDSAFLVNNASGSGVFNLNQNGDLSASGSATFSQLIAQGLNIVRGAQADSSITETIASGSAGTAVIYKGQIERTIISPFVKATSLIYITPTSDTNGQAPYVARINQCQNADAIGTSDSGLRTKNCVNSFTIQVPSLATTDIHMNWWIVN